MVMKPQSRVISTMVTEPVINTHVTSSTPRQENRIMQTVSSFDAPTLTSKPLERSQAHGIEVTTEADEYDDVTQLMSRKSKRTKEYPMTLEKDITDFTPSFISTSNSSNRSASTKKLSTDMNPANVTSASLKLSENS